MKVLLLSDDLQSLITLVSEDDFQVTGPCVDQDASISDVIDSGNPQRRAAFIEATQTEYENTP